MSYATVYRVIMSYATVYRVIMSYATVYRVIMSYATVLSIQDSRFRFQWCRKDLKVAFL